MKRCGQAQLAADLLGLEIEVRGTVVDPAEPRRDPGVEEHRLADGGLAASALADDADVANLRDFLSCHSVPPSRDLEAWARSFEMPVCIQLASNAAAWQSG